MNEISIIFFGVGIAALLPVLYYHYRKNPHPKFRPSIGEMAVLTVLGVSVCAGIAFAMGAIMYDPSVNLNKPKGSMRKPDTQEASPGSSSDGNAKQGGGGFFD